MYTLLSKYYILCIKLDDVQFIKDNSRVELARILLYNNFALLFVKSLKRDIYYYLNMFKYKFNIPVFYNKKEILSEYEIKHYRILSYTKTYLDFLEQYIKYKRYNNRMRN